MNTKMLNISVAALILAGIHSSNAQEQAADLRGIPEGKGWSGSIDAIKLIEKDGAPAIEFNKRGQNVVWIDGFAFKNGTIEFDAKGKGAPPQSSFIGVAFRVADLETHDAIYFRPFNFHAEDPQRRAHAVQYVSEPEWPWRRLRNETPGKFEQPVDPAPDGDAWFHVKVVLQNRKVGVFVNGEEEPSLAVSELSKRPAGSVGLWCNGYGVISNLKITPSKKEKVAVTSAEKWLGIVDEGNYAESWKESAEYFRNAVKQDQWESAVQAVRKPLGKLVSRKMKSTSYKTSLPGAPDGKYVVVEFDTVFENKKTAVETVTPMMDKDGAWRVAGYYIK